MTGNFDRDTLARRIGEQADLGILIGTSSWKYPGWRGMIYDDARYTWRGRFTISRFERHCLTEYSRVFKTVSVDASYYQFPREKFVKDLNSQVPDAFQFSFKASADITVRRFPRLPRFGLRAGNRNENFLNAEMFQSEFLGPLEPLRSKVGLVMFEFARFDTSEFERGRDFVHALDAFLEKLPKGWRYGVEIRNTTFLQADYFEVLARHGVTHIYNSWEAMPSIVEQIALPGSRTTPDLAAARLLLKPGRRYEEAVKMFSPYSRVQEPNPEARSATVKLIQGTAPGSKVFIYVNNRLEGNALETINAILAELAAGQ